MRARGLTSGMLHYGASVSEVEDRSQVAVFKSALFTEHSNADSIKKTRTVADAVTSVGVSGDLDPCLRASVASLGISNATSNHADGGKARLPLV